MQLAKSTIPNIINKLSVKFKRADRAICCGFLFLIFGFSTPVFAQDNSPYSRYGIGDLVPPTHIISRGMGGVSAAYADMFSINYNNPASFASFQAVREVKSKKLLTGRAILDVGVNIDSRTLSEPARTTDFTSNNALFSYVQIGMPIKNNWGLSFGLRPVSRIGYSIIRNEKLKDPNTGLPIEDATTVYTGNGGAYKASVGTGISLFEVKGTSDIRHKLSVGVNASFLFGSKNYSSQRSLLNDTVSYYQANYETKSNFSGLHFDAGIQYRLLLNETKRISATIGGYGSWGQEVNATQDILRETFEYDPNVGNLRLDSVSDKKDIKGTLKMPSMYTVGFIVQKPTVFNKQGGWLFGADFSQENWSEYRFYNKADSVQDSWQFRIGAAISPVPKRAYFTNVTYRFGFFVGPDYIRVGRKLQNIGGSVGLGLPVALSRQAPNQVTLINLAFEYGKRGNDENLLKESLFRISVGFSLSDNWFMKRKYD